MHDIEFIDVLKGLHNIFQKAKSLWLRKFLLFFEIVSKVSILTELSYNIHVVACLVDIIEPDNIFMNQLFHYLNFTMDIFKVVEIGKYFFLDDFDCSRLIVL